jgi:hypothetical protein
MARVAIGFRAHSGWAALVAVAGSPASPMVLDRRRIEIADPNVRGSVQPYHQAAELGLQKAENFLKRCSDSSCTLALAALRRAMDDLGSAHQVIACGLLLSSGRPLGTLESTLASHAAIHTAEGEFFRESLKRAAEACGLRCNGVREKELFDVAARTFGIPVQELQVKLGAMGKSVGPPWTVDEKNAALVGWLACAHLS